MSADPRPLSGSELARSSLLRSAARPYCRESGSSRRRARAAWVRAILHRPPRHDPEFPGASPDQAARVHLVYLVKVHMSYTPP